MADFQSNKCITSRYIVQFYVRTVRIKKSRFGILLLSSNSSNSSFFSRPSAILSYLLTLVYIYVNPLHFLARSAVRPQMSCTSCLSNNDIQTPDQVSIPCTTPYFHKETLTPPSSSRSPPLEEVGVGQTRMRPATHLYITHILYFEIYTTLLEVIQLMSIAGYEAYVCVCFFIYKTLCAAFIWLP